jgi:hypothetical protein
MASARALAWIDALVWVFIYGGMFSVILGIATHGTHGVAGLSLGVLGGIAIVAGVVLIGVRSRLQEAPVGGAQSSNNDRTTRLP